MMNLKVAKFDKDKFCRKYKNDLEKRYTEDMKFLKRKLKLEYLLIFVSICFGLMAVLAAIFVFAIALINYIEIENETNFGNIILTVTLCLLLFACGGLGLYFGFTELFSFSDRRDRKEIKKCITDYSSDTGIKNYEEEEHKWNTPYDYFLNHIYSNSTDENKLLCIKFAHGMGASLSVTFVFSLNNEVKSLSVVFSIEDRVDIEEPEINLETCSLVIPYGYDKDILFTNEFKLVEKER